MGDTELRLGAVVAVVCSVASIVGSLCFFVAIRAKIGSIEALLDADMAQFHRVADAAWQVLLVACSAPAPMTCCRTWSTSATASGCARSGRRRANGGSSTTAVRYISIQKLLALFDQQSARCRTHVHRVRPDSRAVRATRARTRRMASRARTAIRASRRLSPTRGAPSATCARRARPARRACRFGATHL